MRGEQKYIIRKDRRGKAPAAVFCYAVFAAGLQTEKAEEVHQPGKLQPGGCGEGEEDKERYEPAGGGGFAG